MAREKKLSHKWLGKKIFRSSGKTRPFSERKRTRKRKKFALFPCVFLSDRRWLCRKWHAIFGKAISARLSTCFSPSHLWLGKKSSPKARPRESIRSPQNCIQFSGDKSEIRAAGGLRKGEKRSVKKSQKGARNRKERQDFIPSAPQGQRKKTRESERKARFFSRAIYAPVPPENGMPFSGGTGSEKNTRIGGDPPYAVENRKRFSTADEGPFFRYFLRFQRNQRKSVLFLSDKGPSSAVKNRKRFSTADGEKKNLRFFFCPPFRFLWNRKDGGPLRFLWNLRGLRKKGEWKEKSKIAQKRACSFLSDHGFV